MKTRRLVTSAFVLVCAGVLTIAWLWPRVAHAQSYIYYVTSNPNEPYKTFSFPTGLIVTQGDYSGSLDFFIADTGNNRIMFWNTQTGGQPDGVCG